MKTTRLGMEAICHEKLFTPCPEKWQKDLDSVYLDPGIMHFGLIHKYVCVTVLAIAASNREAILSNFPEAQSAIRRLVCSSAVIFREYWINKKTVISSVFSQEIFSMLITLQ